LCKVLKKERFYTVKTDHLAKGPTGTKIDDMFGADENLGILINITINKVYVFHKTLKEIEDFFKKIIVSIDNNPMIR
jgi:hypothetical protein